MPNTESHSSCIRPHDLLWLTGIDALAAGSPLPNWTSADWISKSPVVVRRQRLDDASLLPVGLRGFERCHRFAACVQRHAVTCCVSPEALVKTLKIDTPPSDTELPAVTALKTLQPLLDACGLPWGPTGGAGFFLATGLPVLHARSDLDLVVRAALPFTACQIRLLSPLLDYTACRIDLQIDTGAGGFSFAEWMAARGRVLLKTDTGPRLTSDPWQVETLTA